MDLTQYRNSQAEQQRTADLFRLIPCDGLVALDAGARDGYFSRMLARRFKTVVALDLEQPSFSYPRVVCVKGDVTHLSFDDSSFDLVVCAEVLEHIPSHALEKACSELARVTRKHLLVGVPYKQDIRVGRTTCSACGSHNPPWGHRNVFDEARLRRLFAGLTVEEESFVGRSDATTNWVSTFLMDRAGNPYGTYDQEEPCIRCGAGLGTPLPRTMAQKVLTKAAMWAMEVTRPFNSVHANWIHLLLRKP